VIDDRIVDLKGVDCGGLAEEPDMLREGGVPVYTLNASNDERGGRRPQVRLFIAFILAIYLVGVGVALAPAIGAEWSPATVSDLTASVMQELPHAFAWPVRAYRSLRDQMAGPPQPPKD
jgi:hypothetical protein